MKGYELRDNKEKSQYEYVMNGDTPHIEYMMNGSGVIYLTYTSIPRELQGQGVGKQLVADVLEDIDRRGIKCVPQCGFVAGYIRKHPEWKRLIAAGVYV